MDAPRRVAEHNERAALDEIHTAPRIARCRRYNTSGTLSRLYPNSGEDHDSPRAKEVRSSRMPDPNLLSCRRSRLPVPNAG
jgi:hypothetical protein